MKNLVIISIIAVVAIATIIAIIAIARNKKNKRVVSEEGVRSSLVFNFDDNDPVIVPNLEEKPRTVRVYSFSEGKVYTLTGTGKGIPLGDYFLAPDEEVRDGRVCRKQYPECVLASNSKNTAQIYKL